MYIPKQYLVALALVGAIAFGFFSRLITDQLGSGRSEIREQSTNSQQSAPGAASKPAVVGGASFELPAASAGAPVAPAAPATPILSQPGGAGSTTNIYLTIVNSPAGTTTTPPSVNVAPTP